MQHSTSRQLHAYWERVRDGRVAPRRFEIEPAKIASLLPDTFIAECDGPAFRFRLAGTKICEQFGRELRGGDLLGLWEADDRDSFAGLLRRVISEAGIGHTVFHAYSAAARHAKFELVVMPLIHSGHTINRLLGAISALDPPFWLGSAPLIRQELIELRLIRPCGDLDQEPPASPEIGASAPTSVPEARGRFRVYQGGGE